MKNLYILIAILFLGSCSDFLDQEEKTKISKDQLFSTISGYTEALNGAYYSLGQSDYYGGLFIALSELKGGNLKFSDINTNVAKLVNYRPAYEFNHDAENEGEDKFDEMYVAIYRTLNLANTIIEELGNFKGGTQAQRNQILSEAMAIRALCHFDALRFYAQPFKFTQNAQHVGIVYLEKPIKYNTKLKREKVFDSYSKIVEDLKLAETLNTKSINPDLTYPYAYFTKRSIAALLARIYLYKNDWDNALLKSKSVIEDYGIGWIEGAKYNSDWNSNTPNDEQLFFVDKSNIANTELSALLGYESPTKIGYFRVSSDLVNLYDANDNRGAQYINSNNFYYSTKFKETNDKDHFVPIIRLTEMYLIRAEASLNIANKNEPQARQDLLKIKKRYDPTIESINLGGLDLEREVFNERRRELALEGHIFFDYKRLGKNIERTDCSATKNKTLNYPDYRFVMPLPEDTVDLNPDINQNYKY